MICAQCAPHLQTRLLEHRLSVFSATKRQMSDVFFFFFVFLMFSFFPTLQHRAVSSPISQRSGRPVFIVCSLLYSHRSPFPESTTGSPAQWQRYRNFSTCVHRSGRSSGASAPVCRGSKSSRCSRRKSSTRKFATARTR